jgi:hypothetical protein
MLTLLIQIWKHLSKIVDNTGDGKIVFLTSKYAIKIAKNIRGFAQIREEIKIWNKYKHEKLCPILFSFGPLIIQPYLKPTLKTPSHSHITKITSKIKELNVFNTNVGDLYNPSNWGMLNKKRLLLDYGYTKRVMLKYYTKREWA